ncbi:hypothetical protein GOODEAATRI_016063 [Goodea atripinnis]|uniref:Uncharacterized protein n=1 Tax=Goodea atripinnis TaxID=208336 RepID=A0ABV0ML58_9TELE
MNLLCFIFISLDFVLEECYKQATDPHVGASLEVASGSRCCDIPVFQPFQKASPTRANRPGRRTFHNCNTHTPSLPHSSARMQVCRCLRQDEQYVRSEILPNMKLQLRMVPRIIQVINHRNSKIRSQQFRAFQKLGGRCPASSKTSLANYPF